MTKSTLRNLSFGSEITLLLIVITRKSEILSSARFSFLHNAQVICLIIKKTYHFYRPFCDRGNTTYCNFMQYNIQLILLLKTFESNQLTVALLGN